MSFFQDVLNGVRDAIAPGIGGKTLVYPISGATIAAQAAAYTAGDTLGTGNPVKIEVFTKNNGTGILQSIVLADLAEQNGIVDVIVFNANPSATTFTDQAELDIADADIDKIICTRSILAAEYVSFADSSVATHTGIGVPIKNNVAASSTDKMHIWVAFIAREAKTYVANGISANIGILQD